MFLVFIPFQSDHFNKFTTEVIRVHTIRSVGYCLSHQLGLQFLVGDGVNTTGPLGSVVRAWSRGGQGRVAQPNVPP